MKIFSINDIPEFSNKKRIVVVGFIGKSPIHCANKATPLLQKVQTDENGIECHWDERNNILYLHAVTYMDTDQMTKYTGSQNVTKSMESSTDDPDWVVTTGELAVESARIVALVFQLCHVVVLSIPSSAFDMGYIQFFKAVEAFRLEVTPKITEALTSKQVGGPWEFHGRSCCPRLLFHFRRAPPALKKNLTALKKMEHSVEDQIYYVLRKARIITNVCAKSLFAIPKNEEFVYISTDDELYHGREVSTLVQGLVRLCSGEPAVPPRLHRPTFKEFLKGHLDLAFADGFDDNVGKYAMSTLFFELPSAHDWRIAASTIAPVFLSTSPDEDTAPSVLHKALATDVRFSQARCAKVLPIAQAAYTEGLPAYYSTQEHEHKLCVALGVISLQARGPAREAASEALREACEGVRAARTLCEAPSLAGHPCLEPTHDSSVAHDSGVRYVSACDCGRSRAPRPDPYSASQANCDFYEEAARQCGVCLTLLAIPFPVFQPSTHHYKAASVAEGQAEVAVAVEVEGEGEGCGGEGEGEVSPADALSPGEGEGDAHSDEEPFDALPLDTASDNTAAAPVPGAVREARAAGTGTELPPRQPSTTEYLPGMLHLGSPGGLLPARAAWRLLCAGASSLYSHAQGLPEHLQPGLLPHAGTLTALDLPVRAETASIWKSSHSARGRGSKSSHPTTVKVFLGFEFECPRGHRFMGGAGAGWAGALGGAVSLWARCPCRGGCARARLTRLHIVTPKCAQRVTLNPRVQPVPGGPIFIPQPASEGVIKLTPSAYWILRFPYIYEDERGPLTNTIRGKVLGDIIGITD